MKTLDVSSSEFLDIAESPAYSRLSFGGASVSFSVPVSRFSSCPYEDGEIVKVIWRGKTLLIGPVINPEHSLEGTSESWDIKIHDYWWSLSNIQYFVNGRARGLVEAYRANGGGGTGMQRVAVAKVKDALKNVLDHAIKSALLPIKYDLRIDQEAELIPFAYSSATYASLLIQIQKWRPNMITVDNKQLFFMLYLLMILSLCFFSFSPSFPSSWCGMKKSGGTELIFEGSPCP